MRTPQEHKPPFPDEHKAQMSIYCPFQAERKCPQYHNDAICPLYTGTHRSAGQCAFVAIASHLGGYHETLWNWGMITRVIRKLTDAAIGVVKVAKGPITMPRKPNSVLHGLSLIHI